MCRSRQLILSLPDSRVVSGVEEECESELDRVVRWRREELERAGYEREFADILAAAVDVDLHVAVGLLERGCRQSVAVLILL